MSPDFPSSPSSIWLSWLSALVLIVVLIALCRANRWIYLAALPLTAYSAKNGCSTLWHSDGFREAMVQQHGNLYFLFYAGSIFAPVVALASYAYHDLRKGRKSGRLHDPATHQSRPQASKIRSKPERKENCWEARHHSDFPTGRQTQVWSAFIDPRPLNETFRPNLAVCFF